MGRVDTLRLVGAPGSNKVMAGELSRLCKRALTDVRLTAPKKHGSSLAYPFDAKIARVAATYHRTSSRVLWDLAESTADRLEPLYDELCAVLSADDRAVFFDGATISVRARNVGEFAAGERQVVGTVKNAIIDAAKARGASLSVDADAPDVLFAARQHDNTMTVSVDLVGHGMHMRGYRTRAGLAPLRETLAANLLMLSRWDSRSEVMVDPMAGSGTIAIEAALMGPGRPLWAADHPAMYRLPAFDAPDKKAEPLFADTAPRVVANEIDSGTCVVAKENAGRAGVDVPFVRGDFRRLDVATIERLAGDMSTGVIVCNPPYGERIDAELERLYRDLGAWCAQFPGWRAAFLVANAEFEQSFGRKPRVTKPMRNGPIRATFYLYDL